MAITFDPANKRIILDSTFVQVKDIYSRWKEWVRSSDNAKYPQAFSVIGGDPLGGSLFIASYFFLENGWRVRPMESSHTLILEGNISVEGGGVPVVPTLGTFNVSIQYTVPVQAQGIATSGSTLTAQEIVQQFKTELAATLAKIDAMQYSIPGNLDTNIKYVNGQQIVGSGTQIDPWGPA